MNKNDENEIKISLKRGLDELGSQMAPPDFQSLWRKVLANSQESKRPKRLSFLAPLVGILAASVFVFFIAPLLKDEVKTRRQTYVQPTFIQSERDLFTEFTVSTYWEAPSDFLLNDISTLK